MVLNALEKSISRHLAWFFALMSRWLVTVFSRWASAFSVEWCCWYANWVVSVRYGLSLSSRLDVGDVRAIGWNSLASLAPALFGIEMMVDDFHITGKTPWEMQLLSRSHSGSGRLSAAVFNSLLGILSGGTSMEVDRFQGLHEIDWVSCVIWEMLGEVGLSRIWCSIYLIHQVEVGIAS